SFVDFFDQLLLVLQVGSSPKLGVLTSAKQKEQKIAVGDDLGVLSVFQLQKGEPAPRVVFKTEPGSRDITALALSGDEPGVKDKIYVAYGQSIVGYRKKVSASSVSFCIHAVSLCFLFVQGAQFFSFNTSLNEDIANLWAEGERLYTTGEYIYNVFQDRADRYFFMAPGLPVCLSLLCTLSVFLLLSFLFAIYHQQVLSLF
ncbi:MAG TPA: hypothetical protein V6C97_21665, partial [Oculatellaceae cyanobacterium]